MDLSYQTSGSRITAVHGNDRSGNERGQFGSQEQYGTGNFLRAAPASDRGTGDQLGRAFGIVLERLSKRSRDPTRCDSIDANVICRPGNGERAGELNDSA